MLLRTIIFVSKLQSLVKKRRHYRKVVPSFFVVKVHDAELRELPKAAIRQSVRIAVMYKYA